MICKKIWERYLMKEIWKVFILFLLSFYFLYAMIDYSMHLQEIIKSQKTSLKNLGMYYAMLFSKRCDLLIPLALLITTLKVLCSLNRKNELLALQAGGINLQIILRPFLITGFFCIVINYFNFELLIPHSLTFIERFEKQNFRSRKAQKNKLGAVHMIPLKDGSRLIYQEYNPESKELFDVYWIHTADSFWHMKTLSLTNLIPTGKQVDTFFRSEKGLLEKRESYENYLFHSLTFGSDLKNYTEIPMESRSISELMSMQCSRKSLWKEEEDVIQTHLYFKILMPWLSLLVIIGVSPYAVRFSRYLSIFLLFSLGIFGYIALFMIIIASVILGEAHVIHPFWALFTIPIIFFTFFSYKVFKMGKLR